MHGCYSIPGFKMQAFFSKKQKYFLKAKKTGFSGEKKGLNRSAFYGTLFYIMASYAFRAVGVCKNLFTQNRHKAGTYEKGNDHKNTERGMIVIILLTGASHTGKTALAQRLLEKKHYPYLSMDHIKWV